MFDLKLPSEEANISIQPLILLLLLLRGHPIRKYVEQERAITFYCLFLFQRVISEVPEMIAAKLCHVIGNGRNFQKLAPKIMRGFPPKNGGKTSKFGAISDNFRL